MKIIIQGKIPSGNRRAIGKKNGKPFIYKTQQKEIKDIVLQIKQQWRLPTITQEVEIFYTFYFPDRKKRDVDNRLKILNDCLEEAGVIADDNLITDGHFKKRVSKEKGHLTIIEIKEINIAE
ncbi:RusA family crossover junction endodeoxyribonuclease [Persephonella sp.]|uniref:RusA family crossover junction endodeoxyribonuclease n=1 Tax=Persephonella sp. TaxID=2060922 RepID=UPI0026290F46|nr:RusA family crossover junction endodeoxyribonuclease [Persephonella sp.]